MNNNLYGFLSGKVNNLCQTTAHSGIKTWGVVTLHTGREAKVIVCVCVCCVWWVRLSNDIVHITFKDKRKAFIRMFSDETYMYMQDNINLSIIKAFNDILW